MQAFNLLASVPVEGEDSITQLLPDVFQNGWTWGKLKIVWLDWPGNPPSLPLATCIFDLLALLANFTLMVVKASKESQNDKVSCHRSKIDEIGVSL